MSVLQIDRRRRGHRIPFTTSHSLAKRSGGLLGRLGAHLVEIDAGRLAIAHHDLARSECDVDGAHARCERRVPRAVGVVVVELDTVVAALGEEAVSLLQPRPHRIRRGRHVVLAQAHVREASLFEHVRPDAVSAEHDAVGSSRRRRVAHRVVHVRSRVVGDGAAQRPVEVHAVDEQPVVGRQRFEAGAGVAIGDSLGDMDVHADAEIARPTRRPPPTSRRGR